MRYHRFLLFGIAIIIGLGGVLAYQVLGQSYTFRGSLIEPPIPAEDFVLNDQHRQTFRLSDHRGKVVLMFFGYTHCPDVCPGTLAMFRQVKSQLGEKAEHVRFVFVTTDPDRDTPEKLGEYLTKFDPAIIGLTGDHHELEGVWDAYWVAHEKDEQADHADDYLVAHTSRVYAIDADGDLRLTYPYGIDSQALMQDVAYLVDEETASQ